MIGYVTLGTNDIERAARFYDELLAEIRALSDAYPDTYVQNQAARYEAALANVRMTLR